MALLIVGCILIVIGTISIVIGYILNTQTPIQQPLPVFGFFIVVVGLVLALIGV